MGEPSSGPTSLDLPTEWKTARDVIASMDQLIEGLRVKGFGFITALLAADSILGQSSTVSISPPVRLAVIVVTLVLICALFATDMFYVIIQEGAVVAARRIEVVSKLEVKLTDLISKEYGVMHASVYVELIYSLFAVATGVLGYFILEPESSPGVSLSSLAVIASILAIVFVLLLSLFRRKPVKTYDGWLKSSMKVA